MENNITFPITGSMAGAGIYSTIGGVGVVGGFGGFGVGLLGMTTAGIVVGFAVNGANRIGNGDRTAFTAMGLGAVGGAGIASTIGGVGIGFGGSAFGIGITSMTAMGGVFGLGIYGLAKMFAHAEIKEPIAETFNRMEDKISYMDAYNQAMLELNPLFADLAWEQQFSNLEIEDELEILKAKIKSKSKTNTYISEAESIKIEVATKFSWQLVKTIPGHTNSINSFASKNNILASASDDHNIILWDIETGKPLYSFFGSQKVLAVAINQQLVAGTGFDQAITSYKIQDKKLANIISNYRNPNTHRNVIYTLIFNHQGDLLISGSADQTIKVWNAVTGNLKFTLNGHTDVVNSLAISPCDRWLISGSADQTIRIWDLTIPTQKSVVIDEHSHAITALAFTPDGKYFISAAKDNELKLWCLKTRKNLYIYANNINNINSIAISPDSKLMAVANTKGTLQLWDLTTKKTLQSLAASSPVIFNNDGKYLITGDINNRVKIWQIMVENSQSI